MVKEDLGRGAWITFTVDQGKDIATHGTIPWKLEGTAYVQGEHDKAAEDEEDAVSLYLKLRTRKQNITTHFLGTVRFSN